MKKCWTLQQMADKAKLNIATIWKIEHDVGSVTDLTLAKLLRAFPEIGRSRSK